MKPSPVNVSARVGLWVATVFVICSAFLICNMEGRLQESLQTNEKPNPNIPLDDDQSGAREKRSVKQKTQVSSISDLEKRLEALEKRINANNHSVMSPKQQSDWWFLAYVRGRDGRDGREGMTGPPGPPGKPGYPRDIRKTGYPRATGTGTPGLKWDRVYIQTTIIQLPVMYCWKWQLQPPWWRRRVHLPAKQPKVRQVQGRVSVQGHIFMALNMKFGFNPFKHNLQNHDAPCAVCYVKSRATQLMIPARNDCPSGWTEEYHGYLMSGRSGHKKSRNYICIDKDAEFVHGSHADKNGALLYIVEGQCGSLPCLPYVAGRELTCAVCTK
ncbi:hypothetical protein OS493_038400 [Desmophyllum pertusum]|uniref:Short-chain collagen C4 n=1 Tax=Desmophyllum pertusum TaxID=174260 RepID=A0A9W9YHN6_9CNID|nr:hypothetical protein OS493_038400 [Desmophyllum pertusum]